MHLQNDVCKADIYIYKYEKSTVRLTSVGLAHARPNYSTSRCLCTPKNKFTLHVCKDNYLLILPNELVISVQRYMSFTNTQTQVYKVKSSDCVLSSAVHVASNMVVVSSESGYCPDNCQPQW